MQRKNRSGRWTVSPTGHKKGGGIQGISAASAARAETLSDALGTRLWRSLSDKYHSRQLKVLWTTRGALDKWRCCRQVEVLWTTARAPC